jgi:hypothetical protein
VGIEELDQSSTLERHALRRLNRDGVCRSQRTLLKQRQLAKQVAWQEHRKDDLGTTRAGAGDLDLSTEDQMQVLPEVTLAEDMGAGVEVAALKVGCKSLQIGRLHSLE